MTGDAPVFLDPGWRERLAVRLADDAEFAHVAQFTDVTVELSSPQGDARLTIRDGSLLPGAGPAARAIRVHAPSARWAAFFSPVPPPWHNDLLGLARRHDDVELDTAGTALVQNLRTLNRLWEVARAIG